MAGRLGEAPVTDDTLLLLHGTAEDDADGEDEDGQSDPQWWIVVLQLSSTVSTMSPGKIFIKYLLFVFARNDNGGSQLTAHTSEDPTVK